MVLISFPSTLQCSHISWQKQFPKLRLNCSVVPEFNSQQKQFLVILYLPLSRTPGSLWLRPKNKCSHIYSVEWSALICESLIQVEKGGNTKSINGQVKVKHQKQLKEEEEAATNVNAYAIGELVRVFARWRQIEREKE